MAGRPAKPVRLIQLEGKSHRTKSELAVRKRAEQSLLTGRKIRETDEVKNNPTAHAEFLRVKKLLASINKNDDLYGAVMNRYCLLKAEIRVLEEQRDRVADRQEMLDESAAEMDTETYLKLSTSLSKDLIAYDRQIQSKRNMLMTIEKENVMTIASSLRSIPKTPEQAKNPLMEALGRRQA